MHASVLPRAEDDGGGSVLLPERVGELEERVGGRLGELHDDHLDAARLAPPLVDDVGAGRGLRLLLRLLADALELRAELLGLVGAAAEERERLARGHRLDAPHAGADRALGENARTARSPPSCGRAFPPHSSREKPSTSTTRTTSPYFSPKSIIAPSSRASSMGVRKARTGRFSKMRSLTISSTLPRSSGRQRLRVREVEAELVRPNGRAGLAHVVAEHLLERLVQEVGCRVVGHRRKAHLPRDDRANAVAGGEALALEEEHLVLAEAIRGDELGRAPSCSIHPWSLTWPPPSG